MWKICLKLSERKNRAKKTKMICSHLTPLQQGPPVGCSQLLSISLDKRLTIARNWKFHESQLSRNTQMGNSAPSSCRRDQTVRSAGFGRRHQWWRRRPVSCTWVKGTLHKHCAETWSWGRGQHRPAEVRVPVTAGLGGERGMIPHGFASTGHFSPTTGTTFPPRKAEFRLCWYQQVSVPDTSLHISFQPKFDQVQKKMIPVIWIVVLSSAFAVLKMTWTNYWVWRQRKPRSLPNLQNHQSLLWKKNQRICLRSQVRIFSKSGFSFSSGVNGLSCASVVDIIFALRFSSVFFVEAVEHLAAEKITVAQVLQASTAPWLRASGRFHAKRGWPKPDSPRRIQYGRGAVQAWGPGAPPQQICWIFNEVFKNNDLQETTVVSIYSQRKQKKI